MSTRRSFLKIIGALATVGPSIPRSAPSLEREPISVKDFGAIGDGRSHPASEWIPARYRDFASLRADYPDARSPADEIDFLAINKAIRVATERGVPVQLPAGTYRAWVHVRTGNITLLGAGSDRCRLALPDGAWHEVVPENGGKPIRGTPCVIEAGETAAGNRAAALQGLTLSGLTLDGNRKATVAPRTPKEDIFGWGLAMTNFSDVRYRDLVAVDCHNGGVGTFITSQRHDGEARIERCGFALNTPGFDVNSSQAGRWKVRVRDCPYGARLLDNCWDCDLSAEIDDARIAGLVCDNQRANASYRNRVTAVVRGGCRNAGAQIGDGWSKSTFDLTISDVEGVGVNSTGGRAIRGEQDNVFTVRTTRCGQQSAIIGGSKGTWTISSSDDGQRVAPGDLFSVDVQGADNQLAVTISDSRTRRLRGLIFRPSAARNRVKTRLDARLLEPFNDQGKGNRRL